MSVSKAKSGLPGSEGWGAVRDGGPAKPVTKFPSFTTRAYVLDPDLRKKLMLPEKVETLSIERSEAFVDGPGIQVIINKNVSDQSQKALYGYQRDWIIFHDSGRVSSRFTPQPRIALEAALRAVLHYEKNSNLAKTLRAELKEALT